MRFLVVLTFVFNAAFCSFGQHHLSLLAGRNRMDYLGGLQYSFHQKQHVYIGGVELGITRTFGQRRMNPRISVGYGFDCISAEKWLLGPSFQFASSGVVISKQSQTIVYSNEYLVGYFFEYGDRLKFVHQMVFGAMTEGFKNQFNQEKELFWSSGYYASLGIKYRL